jgi:hypothetical protein
MTNNFRQIREESPTKTNIHSPHRNYEAKLHYQLQLGRPQTLKLVFGTNYGQILGPHIRVYRSD